jgi:hypothetical protein
MKLKRSIVCLVSIVASSSVTALFAPVAVGQIPALAFDSGTNAVYPGYAVGWTFTISNTVLVQALGWFDGGSDGFLDSHEVGIFDSSNGTLLTSDMVTSADTFTNGFRYRPISPIILSAGDYIVAGTTGNDPFETFCVNVTTVSNVTFGEGRFIGPGVSNLTFPTAASDRGLAYFGPNLLMEAVRIVQPPHDQVIECGSTVVFPVTATNLSGGPLSYQWQFNGTNVANATNSTLTISNATSGQAGIYTVLVGISPGQYLSSASARLAFSFLDLRMYAGVMIKGAVGKAYRVEYAESLATPVQWMTLSNITSLLTTPYIFIDYDSAGHPRRFYRVVADDCP